MAEALKDLLKYRLRPWLIPLIRALIRYLPIISLRRVMWNSFVERYFSCAAYEFIAPTVFGSRVAGNTADLISRYIYYFGTWEPNLTEWLAPRLESGDVFLDVGANIGYFTLLAARRVGPRGSVIAIEASPSIFERLKRNLTINRVGNALLYNIAAADAKGRLKLFLGPPGNLGTTSLRPIEHGTIEAEVPAERLADVIPVETMKRVRVIKIDVEGAEALVLDGLMPLLPHASARLEIVVEIKPRALKEQGRETRALMAELARHGFHPYHLPNDYSARDYLARRRRPTLARVRGDIPVQMDIVFSRTDADFLQ